MSKKMIAWIVIFILALIISARVFPGLAFLTYAIIAIGASIGSYCLIRSTVLAFQEKRRVKGIGLSLAALLMTSLAIIFVIATQVRIAELFIPFLFLPSVRARELFLPALISQVILTIGAISGSYLLICSLSRAFREKRTATAVGLCVPAALMTLVAILWILFVCAWIMNFLGHYRY